MNASVRSDGSPPGAPPIDPWTAIAQSLGALRAGAQPGEPALRIAEGFADLAVRDAAAVWARAAAEHIRTDPTLGSRLVSLAKVIERLGSSSIDPEARIRCAQANLDARPDLLAGLRPWIDRWATRTREIAWFRSSDTNTIGLAPTRELLDPEWLHRFSNARGNASALQLAPNEPRASGVPSPVVLHGMGTPWALRRICGHFAPLPLGARAKLLVIEEDPERLLDALADDDITELLHDPHTEFFIGQHAQEELANRLDERMRHWSSLLYYAESSRTEEPRLAGLVRQLLSKQGEECALLTSSSEDRYSELGPSLWAERFQHGLGPSAERPLRVMLITTRFSTYIRHAANDIGDAFARAGAVTSVVIEPDDSSEINGFAIAQSISEFRPDVLVLINYTREQFRSLIPDGLPVITWVQDAMTHLFTPESGDSIGPADFVVGSIFKSFVTEHGYPAERCLRFGVPASLVKFKSIAERPREFEFDLIAATNHSESPERMSDRLEHGYRFAGMAPGLVGAVCSEVMSAVESWSWGYLGWTLRDAIDQAFSSQHVKINDRLRESLFRDVARPLANRVLRYRTLRWGAELAEEQGIRFGVFGHGWEDDPEFAPFALGHLDHGDQLRAAYASSALTIHASAHWITHQRLYECAFAGGLPASLLRPDDVDHALRPARAFLDQASIPPTACRVSDRLHCVRATEESHASIALRLAQRIQIGVRPPEGAARRFQPDDILADALVPVGAGDLRSEPIVHEFPSKLEQLRLIDALADTMFSDKATLAELVRRASQDPDWRDARSHRIAQIAERSFSYETVVPHMMSLAAAHLGKPAMPDAALIAS